MHLDFERNRFSEIPTAGFTIMPHMQQRGPRRSARHLRLLFGVSLMALLDAAAASPGAVAGSPPTLSPAWFAARSSPGPAANATAAAQPSMAAVQQSLTNLRQAAQAITAMQRLQAQASAATSATTVPDGLTIGGLQPGAAWTGANQPTQSAAVGRTSVTVQQTAQTATLNWQTFNVGRNTTLHFDQSAGGASANSWVALNRVIDPAAEPSQILGQITAPGQVYILNANGIIFGPAAQINTAALIASSAMLSDQQFADFGIYSAVSNGVYTPSLTGATAPVTVKAGAQITTNAPLTAVQDGGFVMLLGGSVLNAGQITTPAGQTILAAGRDFTLRPGYSVNGVNASTNTPTGNTTSTTLGTEIAVDQGGAVTNSGLIQSSTGDATLVGAAVTQAGVILATTSVAQRGTIHLLTDTTDPTTSVTLGPGSLTYIAPDTGTATASDAQRASAIANAAAANQIRAQASLLNDQVALADQQYQSRIEITTGGTADFRPGSLTAANGGQVAVSAGAPASAPGRILVETGAIIDVSGLVGVSLPASANDLAVNIQGFELRDAPVNRDTTLLNSSNVTVDIRQLTEVPAGSSTAVAAGSAYATNRTYTAGGLLEVSGEFANVTRTIAEWSTLGGTVTLSSPQVVAQPGAQFNLAGGTVQYQAGNVPQSWLIASNGGIYNVNTAPAVLTYTGLYKAFTVTYPRWNVTETFANPLIAPAQIYQAGYTVGRDAGNLIIDAQTTVFEAAINAGVVNGQFQDTSRTGVTNAPFLTDAILDPFLLPQTAVPLGGSLLLGSYNPQGLQGAETTTGLIGADVVPLAASLGAATAIPANRAGSTELPASVLNDSGLASLSLAASGTITIDSSATLSPGGQVSLLAASTQIGGALTSPSGNVTITNIYQPAGTGTTATALTPPATSTSASPSIALTASGAIITHGLWTNLLLDPSDGRTLAYTSGGAISLDTTGALTVPTGSLIDASSGAALLASGATKGGAGGNITLIADDPQLGKGALTAPVTLAGTLRSYGATSGGALTLSIPGIIIADTPSAGLLAGQIALSPNFFRQGFANYVVTGYGGPTDASGNALPGVSVAPGTAIQVVEPVYGTTVQSQTVPTGADPATALSVVLPSLYLPNPVTATLSQRGGASIDLRSRVALTDASAVSGGALDVGTGASITVDPGQKVTLEAYGQITIDGTVTAPSGTISVLSDVSGSLPVNDSVAYLLGLSIWLGGDSVLNVAGQAATALDRYGRPYGNLQHLAGGTVVIGNAQYQPDGSVAVDSTSTAADVTSTDAFVFIRPGAVINASGAAQTIDLPAGQTPLLNARGSALAGPREVAGNGGAISLSSDNGIYIDGTLLAAAGGPTAAGGTLAVALATPLYSLNVGQVPIDTPDVLRVPRDLVVGQATAASLLPASLLPGDASFTTIPGVVGQARLSATQISAGGFDNLLLFVTDSILFDGNVTLRAGQSIQVVSGILGATQATGQATIAAPYVLLRGADALQPSGMDPQNNLTQLFNAAADGGHSFSTLPPCVSGATTCTSATLTVQADLIDIQDQVRFGANLAIPLNPPASGGPAPTLTVDQPGFNTINLVSSGDIRFLVNAAQAANPTVGNPAESALASPGNITLTAAQIYPVTGALGDVAAGFDPTATGTSNLYYPNAALTINGIPGDDPAAPLSAFGSLSLFAGTINQNGIIRAPEGAIELGGAPSGNQFKDLPSNFQNVPYSSAVNLLPGSITSVSMAGQTIPYGGTADGVTFSYDGLQAATVSTGVVNAAIPAGIVVSAQSITLSQGAVLDLSGGGELTSAGFVSGRGGSTNTLLTPLLSFSTPAPGATVTPASLSSTPVYALVAGPQPAYAPTTLVDQSGAAGSTPAIGEQISIGAGVPGLPAGTYTLLPSYYALLPGGYRVQFTTGSTTQAIATTALTNGSYTTPGTIGIANTGIQTTLPTPFTITPGATVRTYSQYDEETYSQFQVAQAALFGTPRAALPTDAKSLELIYPTAPAALSATAPALTVAGSVLTQGAAGGYGSAVAVTTDADTGNLEITAAGATPTAGYVSIAAPQLNALGAQTLNIGGSIGNVVLRNGAVLTGSQVFVSGGAITLEPGSGINTLGSPATPAGLTQTVRNPINAEIEVSNGQLNLGTPAGNGSISIGTCLPGDTCGTGPVTLYSNGTLGFSTLGPLVLGDNVNYGARYITASVADINSGSTDALAAATVPAGLSLSTQLLASLVAGNPSVGAPGLQTLTLTASQSLNFYGDVSLSTINPATGQSSLQQLVLNTPAIYGYTTPGDPQARASLTTGTLVWNGLAAGGASVPPGPVTANGPGTGTGTLTIAASQIVLGYPSGVPVLNGSLMLDRVALGFNTVNLSASGAITVGNSGALSVNQAPGATGTLNLITPLLTGSPGAVASFTAGNAITVQPPAGTAPSTATQTGLGAAVTFSAGSITDSSAIVLPSGRLSMTALTGDVTLATGSRTDLSGRVTSYFDQTTSSWGGNVTLESTAGSVTQAPAALIDVSAVNNNAGSVSATAMAGTVALSGPINGGATAGYAAGGITIRAMVLPDFSGLNQRLNKGGVFGARGFDIGSGDLTIGKDPASGGALLRAHSVSVSLDNGNLTVTGTIDASGAAPGSIALSAGGNLTVAGSAVLDAHGTVAQTDSLGQTIDANNTASVSLTVAGNVAGGINNNQGSLLTLAPGATIDVSAAPGVTCALGPCGQVTLNAPRITDPGAVSPNDVAISAAGPLTIKGAGSVAVNAFQSYQPADANGTIVQDNGGASPVSSTGLLGLNQMDSQDSQPFINAALANPGLTARLAGLPSGYHLRPGVEIDSSSASGGNLTVAGDLDLSGYRYGPNAVTDPSSANYGAGEPGVLVLRAADNLSVGGSITDGFAPPPATPDDQGWVIASGTTTTAPIVYQGPANQTLTVGATAAANGGTTFPNNDSLSYAVAVAPGAVFAKGTVLPVAVTLGRALRVNQRFTTTATIRIGSHTYTHGATIPAFTTIPANTSLPAGFTIPSVTTSVPFTSAGALTWPANTQLTDFTTATITLATGDMSSMTLRESLSSTFFRRTAIPRRFTAR